MTSPIMKSEHAMILDTLNEMRLIVPNRNTFVGRDIWSHKDALLKKLPPDLVNCGRVLSGEDVPLTEREQEIVDKIKKWWNNDIRFKRTSQDMA